MSKTIPICCFDNLHLKKKPVRRIA